MINFSVTYSTNKKAEVLEQAAGFPPFTRGYAVLSKNVQISNYKDTDFVLEEYTDENIIDLFTQIISRKIKGTLPLNVPFTGNVEEIIYLRVLRTLLAFISDKLHNNPTLTKFEFYGNNVNESVSLNTLVFANAAQLDVLIVNNMLQWKSIQQLISPTPVDILYGSSFLEDETVIIFFRLWKQILKTLT